MRASLERGTDGGSKYAQLALHIISSSFPPDICGIGDYTARLAEALSTRADVTVLTGRRDPLPLPGVRVNHCFSRNMPRSVLAAAETVITEAPEWCLLQYEPDSFAHRGVSPFLIQAVRRIQRSGRTRVAIMTHELARHPVSAKTRIAYAIHLAQFQLIASQADTLFFSIGPWAERFHKRFPHATVGQMPIGSNIPHVPIDPAEARRRLGIAGDVRIFGLFGRLGSTMDMEAIRRAVAAVGSSAAGASVLLLYVGTQGDVLRSEVPGVPAICDGPVPADEVSRRFAAMDLFLFPDPEGASARRTRLMTSLQHSVASVTTTGVSTDAVLREAEGTSLLLAPAGDADAFAEEVARLEHDKILRSRIGAGGHALYEREFGWERILQLWSDALGLTVMN